MPFTVIDPGIPDDHWCDDSDMPDTYVMPTGAVIKCDICGQNWVNSKFHLWEKTSWEPDNGNH